MPIKIDLQAKTAEATPPEKPPSDQAGMRREPFPENKIRPIDLRNLRKSKANIADLSR